MSDILKVERVFRQSENREKRMISRLSFAFITLFAFCTANAADKTVYTVADGKLDGSLYKIALPQKWNKKLLLIAHGGLPENAPLSADFEIEKTYVEELLKEGWMVAESSYRRNGIFVTDGVTDLNTLFDFIAKEYGRPERTYLTGASMGGKIAVKIAEETPGRFDAVLAVGAAFLCDDNGTSSEKNIESFKKLTFKPNIPVLFLSNVNEVALASEYAELASSTTANTTVWKAVRRGHCNVNDSEMLKAMRALVDWLEKNRKPVNENISIEITRAKSAARQEKGRLYGRISHVAPAYGNLTADVTRADLEKAGIKQDTYFNVGFKKKKFRVFLGYNYADVKKGEWVAFLTAEDYLQIAMNWDNAQKQLGCKEGDEIFLEAGQGQ